MLGLLSPQASHWSSSYFVYFFSNTVIFTVGLASGLVADPKDPEEAENSEDEQNRLEDGPANPLAVPEALRGQDLYHHLQ